MMPDSDSPDIDFKLPDGTQFKGNLQDAMSSLPNSMQPDLQRIGADIAQRNPVERNPAAPGNDPIVNKMQDYYAGIEKDRARQQGMLDQDRLQNQEQRHAVTEDMKRQMAEGPQRVAQPSVPKPKPEEITPVFGALMVMAALSGMGARNHAAGALNAMNGVMEGAHTGNQELYQRSMKEFEEKSKQAIAAQKQMTDEWDRKIKINEMSREELDNEAQLFALKYPQLKLDEAIQRGEAGHMFKVIESARTATTKAEEQTRKFTEAQTPIDAKTVDYYAQQSLSGDNSWQVGLARGKVGQKLIAAVKDRIPQMAAERGMSPQDAIVNKAMQASEQGALKQRVQNLAATQQFVKNMDSQMALVEKYLEPGTVGGTPVINKWIQAGRKKVAGDEDVSALDVAIRGLAREHQRIVTGVTSNAQLHVSAQETADELLNIAQTPEQVKAVIKVMREEVDNAVKSGKSEVADLGVDIGNIGKYDAGKSATVKRTGTHNGRKVIEYSDGRVEYAD